jgi:predicted GH43/DUF377 family glycosyl hydrolase
MKDFHALIPSGIILDKLNNTFTYGELRDCLKEVRKTLHLAADKEILFNQIMWLALSHYELQFSMDTNISERVIFPVSVNEKNGIEDARFVKFTEDNGETIYYATYTAYDGTTILPKMLETRDFYHFKILPLHGEIAQNKGMALFPRKVNGKYAMRCRLMVPNAEEREGYVPNVVYSCGSMIHNDELIIPYAMSDYASTYATVNLQELLNELKKTNQDV